MGRFRVLEVDRRVSARMSTEMIPSHPGSPDVSLPREHPHERRFYGSTSLSFPGALFFLGFFREGWAFGPSKCRPRPTQVGPKKRENRDPPQPLKVPKRRPNF